MVKPNIDAQYTPGVCNINPKETQYRRRTGQFGVIAAILLLLILVFFDAHFLFALVIYPAVLIGAVRYLQAKNNFCVKYATNGKYNPDEVYARTHNVEIEEDHQKDISRARELYTQAHIISAIATVFAIFILVLL